MKAKHFKKIRQKVRWFSVTRSRGMFGDFSIFARLVKATVLARNPKEAAYRFMKRNNCLKDFNAYDERATASEEIFAKLKIVPADTPFERFVTYWR